MKANRLRNLFLIILMVALAIAALGWAIHSVMQENTLGLDYYIFWHAGRAMFLEHQNPYTESVTNEIQMGIYGRPALPDENPMRFAYPPFGISVILPFLFFSYDWSQAFWLALNIILSVLLIFPIFKGQPKPGLFLFLSWYPLFFGLILGNLAILISAVIIFSFAQLSKDKPTKSWLIIAGILSSWAVCKPQVSGLLIGFLCLYAIKKQNWVYIKSFFVGLALNVGLSFLAFPGWVTAWISQLRDYSQYNQVHSLIMDFLGLFGTAKILEPIGWLILGLGIFACLDLIWQWWHNRADAISVIVLLGLVSFCIPKQYIAYDQITLYIPVFLWLATKVNRKSAQIMVPIGVLCLTWLLFGLEKMGVDSAKNLIPAGLYLIWMIGVMLQDHKEKQELAK